MRQQGLAVWNPYIEGLRVGLDEFDAELTGSVQSTSAAGTTDELSTFDVEFNPPVVPLSAAVAPAARSSRTSRHLSPAAWAVGAVVGLGAPAFVVLMALSFAPVPNPPPLPPRPVSAVAVEATAVSRVDVDPGVAAAPTPAVEVAREKPETTAADIAVVRRAFAELTSRNLDFEHCAVRLTSAGRAVASCGGLRSPTAGETSQAARRAEWVLDLNHAADRWQVVGVAER